jgi:hypothetical protein
MLYGPGDAERDRAAGRTVRGRRANFDSQTGEPLNARLAASRPGAPSLPLAPGALGVAMLAALFDGPLDGV